MLSHVLCILSCAISRQSTSVKVQTCCKNEQLARIGELIFKEKFGNSLGKKQQWCVAYARYETKAKVDLK